MDNEQTLIPDLFRTEYKKIVAVLCRLFGIGQIEIAEDIAGETFIAASEVWSLKGLPDNPTAWLYAVAKNKARDYFKHQAVFVKNVVPGLRGEIKTIDVEIDLSVKNISDSQLAMIFAVCNPVNSEEAQIGLALNILCGFGVEEIAGAFLTNRDVIYKRLQRAKEKLKTQQIRIEPPSVHEIDNRLETVLRTLYLLFNEGYHSTSQDRTVRTEFCFEAMQLTKLLLESQLTNTPVVNGLFSLMCFQASRLAARTDEKGEMILYNDQDASLWDQTLIAKGTQHLDQAMKGDRLSKYQLEAAIAFWHTSKDDTHEKWENILQLYNMLLMVEYSPVIALNRTYALSKANGKEEAIVEGEKIELKGNPFYHSLMGNIYTDVDNSKAIEQYRIALTLAPSNSMKQTIDRNIARLERDEHK
ncbi:DUF6596 domain-containing protein [Chryseolinea sp. T2]|uniref:RNA polymerase sigma factor n=1 Tax=Chryseolinea sp. T2 TaxID=3129255 RepID=UPI0030776A4A